MRPMMVLMALLGSITLGGCQPSTPQFYQGWVEADSIFISPDEPGRIVRMDIREGDHVETGAPLFTLDDDIQRADLNQATATFSNAKQIYDRAIALSKTGSGTQATLDAATSSLHVAEARVASAQTRLDRRRSFSPTVGQVQQLYFRVGELVGAQRPILSILPPAGLKIRFFVPQHILPRIKLGERVAISCDGCGDAMAGEIIFLSTTAEYTPPVIYSQEERSKLVFLIQARPDDPTQFRVGQPVQVRLAAQVGDKQ